MWGKNSFKILKKTKNKHPDSLRTGGLDKIDIIGLEFVHIPSKAFRNLRDDPGHSYLKDGLYLSTDRFHVTEKIKKVSEIESEFLSSFNIGQEPPFLTWEKSKELCYDLEGKMMTLAEYFKIRDYVEDFGDQLLFDQLHDKKEWLDTLYRIKDKNDGKNRKFFSRIYANIPHDNLEHYISLDPDTDPEDKSDGYPIKLMGSTHGWFKKRHIDQLTGFPTRLYGKGDYHYNTFKRRDGLIVRSSHKKRNGEKTAAIVTGFPAYIGWGDCSFRLCYTKDGKKKIEERLK